MHIVMSYVSLTSLNQDQRLVMSVLTLLINVRTERGCAGTSNYLKAVAAIASKVLVNGHHICVLQAQEN